MLGLHCVEHGGDSITDGVCEVGKGWKLGIGNSCLSVYAVSIDTVYIETIPSHQDSDDGALGQAKGGCSGTGCLT